MRCLEEKTLRLYIDGELSSKRVAKIDHHLATCDRCRQGLADARNKTRFFKEKLALLYPGELPEPVPREFPAASRKKRLPVFALPGLRLSTGLAGILLLAVAGLFLVKTLMPPPPPGDALFQAVSLQTEMTAHIENTRPIMIEYANCNPLGSGKSLIDLDKQRARELLLENRLIQGRIGHYPGPEVEELLEDMEIILTEISNLDADHPEKLALIKELIRIKKTLYKMETLNLEEGFANTQEV